MEKLIREDPICGVRAGFGTVRKQLTRERKEGMNTEERESKDIFD